MMAKWSQREKKGIAIQQEKSINYLTFLPPSYAHVLIVESNTRGGYWISYSRLEFLFFLPTTKYAKKNRTVSLEIQHSWLPGSKSMLILFLIGLIFFIFEWFWRLQAPYRWPSKMSPDTGFYPATTPWIWSWQRHMARKKSLYCKRLNSGHSTCRPTSDRKSRACTRLEWPPLSAFPWFPTWVKLFILSFSGWGGNKLSN